MIPYGKQDITLDDLKAVKDVLESDYLTQGPKVPDFENHIKKYTGAKFAYALNSATSALHVACMALELKKGDNIWTSPVSFVASANVGLYCNANIDFVDIDPRTFNMCPINLEKKLIVAEKNNTLPKILIPVHLAGQSCEMEKISELCKKFKVSIIEDASHAIGGSYQGNPIGSCQFSDIAVFSFHPVKIITTGEGGAALTNDRELAKKISLLRSHGITRDSREMVGPSHGQWYYEQIYLGFNYRMTDIHAALGASQIKRLDTYILKRHQLASRYNKYLKDLPLRTPFQNSNANSSFHLYIIRLELEKISKSHKEVFDTLRSEGVGVNLHYIPIHLQPYYKSLGFSKGDFPESEKYYSEAISLPIYPNLSLNDQDKVIEILKNILI